MKFRNLLALALSTTTAIWFPAQARQMDCVLNAMPGMVVSTMFIDTEADHPVMQKVFDPSKPGTVLSDGPRPIVHSIHTEAIPANKHGIGAKGPSSMYVTWIEKSDSGRPQRPLIIHIEWDEGLLFQIGSEANQNPGVQVSDHWECAKKG